MASRFTYNPKTNRWEKPTNAPSGDYALDNTPPGFSEIKGQTYVDAVTGETKIYDGLATPDSVVPKASTTSVPKKSTPTPTPSTTTARTPTGVTSNIPAKNPNYRPPQQQQGQQQQPVDNTIANAVAEALKGSGLDSNLLRLLFGASSSGDSTPSAAQKVATAKKVGKQNLALAKKFYGQQQKQGQQQIAAATEDLLKNLKAPTAYTNVPLVAVPPALQGLQQNLLSYGGTGGLASGQRGEDIQASDMYAALAKRGAEQLGAAESSYFDALKNAALQAQTAGTQGLGQNTNALLGQVMLQNLQAILNAQA